MEINTKHRTSKKKLEEFHAEEYEPELKEKVDPIEETFALQIEQKLQRINESAKTFIYDELFTRKSLKQNIDQALGEYFDFNYEILLPIVGIALLYQRSKLDKQLSAANLSDAALESVLGIDFTPDPTKYERRVKKREAYLNKVLKETTYDKIVTIINEGLESGEGFSEIAAAIDNSLILGDAKGRAELIARTETNYFLNDIQRQYAKDLGIGQYKISLANDACEQCKSVALISGQRARYFDINTKDILPIHPRCRCVMISVIPKSWITADTLVKHQTKNVNEAIQQVRQAQGELEISKATMKASIDDAVKNIKEIRKGDDGKTPIKGKDYFTKEDIETITKNVTAELVPYAQNASEQTKKLEKSLLPKIEQLTPIKSFQRLEKAVIQLFEDEEFTEDQVKTIRKLVQDEISKLQVWVEGGSGGGSTDLSNYYTKSEANDLFVLKAGDTMTGDLGFTNAGIQNVDFVQYNIAFADGTAEGRMQWNSDDGALEFGLPGGNVVLQIGQEMLLPKRARNTTGSDISNGQLVYISGVSGQQALISLADASTEATSDTLIGMATEDIPNNGSGYVATYGLVRGDDVQPIDTSAYAPGTLLWLSTTAGGFTSTEPISPDHAVKVGRVWRQHATRGEILISIEHGDNFAQLHDVLFTSLANGDIPQYNSGTGLWENVTNEAILTNAVIINPGSSTRNVIQATGNFVPLVTKASVGQSENLFETRDSGNNLLTYVNITGDINVSGNVFRTDGSNLMIFEPQVNTHNTDILKFQTVTANTYYAMTRINFGTRDEIAPYLQTDNGDAQYRLKALGGPTNTKEWRFGYDRNFQVFAFGAVNDARTGGYSVFQVEGYANGGVVVLDNAVASAVPLTIQDHGSQSADSFRIQTSGGTDNIRMIPGGGAIFNEQGNAVDFRIESDSYDAFFVDGSDDATYIMNNASGKVSFFGATAVVRVPAYTPTNVTTDRSYDADSTTVDELADVLGTLITDLTSYGLLQ